MSARHRRPAHRTPLRRLAVVVAAVVLAVTAGVGTAYAFFTDSGTVTSGTISAGTLAAPSSVACSTSGGVTAVRWPAVSPTPTGYRVEWSYTNGLYGDSGTVDLPAGTTQWQPASGGLLFTRTYTVAVRTLDGSWTSAARTASPTIRFAPTTGTMTCV